ncbi:MAG TPA: MFS transporter [Candidatus Limnocylindria bacterium]|nr:MFS transporter [Candidatus Limnocylindria bacterium]
MDVTDRSLWRNGDFMKLWTGQTVSELGSVVTRTALPIAAVITLHASPLQVGILVASASIAVLLVGLFAGALVDRSRRRPLMIAADAIRAALLLSIPFAAITGSLRIEQLYVVAFLEAAFGSVFDVAYRTYLPSLLPADRLLEGNAKIGMSSAIAEIGGPGIAGALVQLITAPMAMLVDAVSYLFSAFTIGAIRAPEGSVEHVDGPAGLWRQLAEGFGAVARHRLLRPMALASMTSALFGNFFAALYTIYALDDLGLSPFLLGVVISAGGVGSLAASLVVGPLTRRAGFGPAIVWTQVAAGVLASLIPLAGGPPLVAATFLFIPQLFGDGLDTVSLIDQLTVRQQVTPPQLLGRVNGTMHVLLEGVGSIGALAGAALAEAFGIRTAIWISVAGSLAGVGFLIFSPLRSLRTVEGQ